MKNVRLLRAVRGHRSYARLGRSSPPAFSTIRTVLLASKLLLLRYTSSGPCIYRRHMTRDFSAPRLFYGTTNERSYDTHIHASISDVDGVISYAHDSSQRRNSVHQQQCSHERGHLLQAKRRGEKRPNTFVTFWVKRSWIPRSRCYFSVVLTTTEKNASIWVRRAPHCFPVDWVHPVALCEAPVDPLPFLTTDSAFRIAQDVHARCESTAYRTTAVVFVLSMQLIFLPPQEHVYLLYVYPPASISI